MSEQRRQVAKRGVGAVALGVLAAVWLLVAAAQTPPGIPAGPPSADPASTPTAAIGRPAATPAATPAPFDIVALEQGEDLELAQRYAPIMYIKAQPEPCSTDGEQYLPAPVEIVFGDESVTLREAPDRDTVAQGPTADDLYARSDQYYLDLRGHPRLPGCDYETHFKQLMGDQRPVIYAYVTTEPGQPGLALQYWFFYYFNEFNDKHEGDWEMIQLLFDDANTPLEALASGPTRVAYAQHSGGEPAYWDEARVDKENGRPVVYVASGSHASFYDSGIWLGWGSNGAGLGCDITTGPSVRLDPEVRLVPPREQIDGPAHPYAWATFGGRWGERDSWVYNGPRGPNLNERWTAPFTWHDGVQAGAVRLQNAEILGPAPTSVFCDLAVAGSDLLTLSRPYPWLVWGFLAVAAGVIVAMVRVAWPAIRAAWSLYWRHLRLFALLSGLVAPFILAVNGFAYLVNRYQLFGAALGVTEDDGIVSLIAGTGLLVQQGLLWLIVAPATVAVASELHAGRTPTIAAALRLAADRFWANLGAQLRALGLVLVLVISIVGIPWAIMWSGRWLFVAQRVMLEGEAGRAALRGSSDTVRHHWWRVVLTNGVLTFAVTGIGPVVGLALLIIFNTPQDLLNAVSSLLFVIVQPFSTIGMTLLYLRLRQSPLPAPAAATPPVPAPVPTPPDPAPPTRPGPAAPRPA